MKTNEVTGRIRTGWFAVSLELGRPGAGTTFREVERLTRACAGHPVRFEPRNPLTRLMTDRTAGRLDPSILDERVMSIFVELHVPREGLEPLLADILRLAPMLETVLSVGLSMRAGRPDRGLAAAICRKLGLTMRPNGKTNIGLGRPVFNLSKN